KSELQALIADRQQQIVFEITDNIPAVHGDHNKLRQVLVNLLSNASKFSPDGSDILVELATLPHLSPPAVSITVSDSGIGIPAGEYEMVFDKFTQSGAGGTGLGLAISREIVKAHQGTIVTSQSRQGGAEFTVTLPLTQG
ncbi:MAG: ATP-binding protein, partial [Pseudomonadota bacterium]